MMKYYRRLLGVAILLFTSFVGTASAQSDLVRMGLVKRYDTVWADTSEGLIVVNKGKKIGEVWSAERGKFGYVDTLGQEVIPLIYDDARNFSNGYAVVGKMDSKGMRYGLIDRTGSLVIPCEWSRIQDMSEGIALSQKGISIDRTYFLIDTLGSVKPSEYDYCRSFSNGYAVVGKGVFELDAPDSLKHRKDLSFLDYFVGKHGYITPDGTLAIPLHYDDARDFSPDGLAAVAINGQYYPKWGFIDKKGETFVPCSYYNVADFSCDRAMVCKVVSGKLAYGYLDRSGKELIPCQYDMATSFRFKNTWVGIEKDGETQYKLIDLNGNTVMGTVLDLNDSGKFGQATAAIRDGNGRLRYGILDINGRVLLPFEYDHITLFSEIDPQTGRFVEAATATKNGEKFSFDITKN